MFAIVSLLLSPAFAADCYEITGYTGTGSVGDTAIVDPVSCSFTGAGWVWFEITHTYGSSWPDTLWVVVPPTDPHLSGTTYNPLLVLGGVDGFGEPILYLDIITGSGGSTMGGSATPPDPCWADVYWFDGSWIDAIDNGSECYVAPVPSGQTPFIWSNHYYIAAQPVCPLGSASGSACVVMSATSGSFVSGNRFYDRPTYGSALARPICARGTWDGVGCLLGTADPDTTAYIARGSFMTTQQPACADGWFDGANCYMGTPPSGTTATTDGAHWYYEP